MTTAPVQLPHGMTRRDLVEDRVLWAVMAVMFLLVSGVTLALELRRSEPSPVTVALMGAGIAIGLIVAVTRPPAPGTLANLVVLAVVCGSALIGLTTAHSEVFVGAVLFVGPQLALRLEGRRQVALSSAAFALVVVAIGIAGLLGAIAEMAPLTALAVLVLVPAIPVLALTFETTLDAGEREGEVLERLTRRDALTGVHNRRGMMEELAAALEHARSGGPATGVLVLDLDRFKAINDGHGHAAGDRVLADAAEALTAAFPAPSIVTRAGGDEFCVIVVNPASDPAAAARAATTSLAGVETPAGPLTAGIGQAVFPADGEDLDTLLRTADGRMRETKTQHRAP